MKRRARSIDVVDVLDFAKLGARLLACSPRKYRDVIESIRHVVEAQELLDRDELGRRDRWDLANVGAA